MDKKSKQKIKIQNLFSSSVQSKSLKIVVRNINKKYKVYVRNSKTQEFETVEVDNILENNKIVKHLERDRTLNIPITIE